MQPQHQQMWRRCLSFYRMPIVLSLHWKAIAYPGFISKQSTYVFALQNLSSGQDLLSIYMAQALADHTDQRRANLGAQRDAAIPCALQRIGALRLAMVRASSKGQTACRGFCVPSILALHSRGSHALTAQPSPFFLQA